MKSFVVTNCKSFLPQNNCRSYVYGSCVMAVVLVTITYPMCNDHCKLNVATYLIMLNKSLLFNSKNLPNCLLFINL